MEVSRPGRVRRGPGPRGARAGALWPPPPPFPLTFPVAWQLPMTLPLAGLRFDRVQCPVTSPPSPHTPRQGQQRRHGRQCLFLLWIFSNSSLGSCPRPWSVLAGVLIYCFLRSAETQPPRVFSRYKAGSSVKSFACTLFIDTPARSILSLVLRFAPAPVFDCETPMEGRTVSIHLG